MEEEGRLIFYFVSVILMFLINYLLQDKYHIYSGTEIITKLIIYLLAVIVIDRVID